MNRANIYYIPMSRSSKTSVLRDPRSCLARYLSIFKALKCVRGENDWMHANPVADRSNTLKACDLQVMEHELFRRTPARRQSTVRHRSRATGHKRMTRTQVLRARSEHNLIKVAREREFVTGNEIPCIVVEGCVRDVARQVAG
jgi:hypothetical protein